ncbi:hypothetical protein KBX37_29320 [Micromonospora sp. U56]|uniref:hypothetical protein n=1 Tax=Micromonospora sp. U56 TaxID=2824900 RepID=UPI001B36D833|nr:hypothetical protein [Micromonospora sp. U56]MBQ0897130.1 hypothetical protein [Micromonospora sp. U56]
MLALTQIDVDSSFMTHLLPAQVVLGLGLGFTFMPLSSLALVGVPEHDAGAASATLNATQQIGGSLGTALLNTFFTSAVTAYLASRVPDQATMAQAAVHGYSVAFAWGAGLILVAGLATMLLIKVRKEDLATTSAVHLG